MSNKSDSELFAEELLEVRPLPVIPVVALTPHKSQAAKEFEDLKREFEEFKTETRIIQDSQNARLEQLTRQEEELTARLQGLAEDISTMRENQFLLDLFAASMKVGDACVAILQSDKFKAKAEMEKGLEAGRGKGIKAARSASCSMAVTEDDKLYYLCKKTIEVRNNLARKVILLSEDHETR